MKIIDEQINAQTYADIKTLKEQWQSDRCELKTSLREVDIPNIMMFCSQETLMEANKKGSKPFKEGVLKDSDKHSTKDTDMQAE